MATISLCMIVKNEETVLARCLDSVQHLADEIIIVDTGSDDSTQEIASRYTNKIYSYPWPSILQLHETFPSPKRHKNIFSGWMQMMSSKSHTWKTSFSGKNVIFKTPT